jgi:hypothetical protein
MKNPIDTIGNRTRDFPDCTAVPQRTASPRTPFMQGIYNYIPETNHGSWVNIVADVLYLRFIIIIIIILLLLLPSSGPWVGVVVKALHY